MCVFNSFCLCQINCVIDYIYLYTFFLFFIFFFIQLIFIWLCVKIAENHIVKYPQGNLYRFGGMILDMGKRQIDVDRYLQLLQIRTNVLQEELTESSCRL